MSETLGAGALRERGLRATPQRLAILDFLGGHRGHHTAEAIFEALRRTTPSLSKTTVYNALEALHRGGLVQVVTISDERRYEAAHPMHHHFLCLRCGAIIDIDVACPFGGSSLCGEHRVEEVHGYFKGTCARCLGKGAVKDPGGR